MAYDYFNKVSRFFKESGVTNYPISVRRTKLSKKFDGFCQFQEDKFVIKINRLLAENYSIEVLIHEIAHVMSWDTEKNFHGINWGKAYSKAYRLFLERFIEK